VLIMNAIAHDKSGQQALAEEALFSVPIWRSSVPEASWWIPRLIEDIDTILENDSQDFATSSGHQTRPELHLRKELHWTEFFKFIASTFEAISTTAPRQRYQAYGLRSWGLRINSASSQKDLDCGATRVLATHNHSPALLTSVFTCELPEYPDAGRLATIFHNPAAHINCPWQPQIAPVAPQVGTLLVFPGWLEHSVPVVAPIPPGQRRVTINTDYFPEFR
jgi:hypothetical protein